MILLGWLGQLESLGDQLTLAPQYWGNGYAFPLIGFNGCWVLNSGPDSNSHYPFQDTPLSPFSCILQLLHLKMIYPHGGMESTKAYDFKTRNPVVSLTLQCSNHLLQNDLSSSLTVYPNVFLSR